MKTRFYVSLFLALLGLAGGALAAPASAIDAASVSSRYVEWAGGKANADALVAGLTAGASIALATGGPDRSASIAGFTPTGTMSAADADDALASARRRLARLGIQRPSAEQIQAALIGGDVITPEGSTVMVQGSLAARGLAPVAAR